MADDSKQTADTGAKNTSSGSRDYRTGDTRGSGKNSSSTSENRSSGDADEDSKDEQDASEQQASEQDASEQDASEQDASEQDASGRDADAEQQAQENTERTQEEPAKKRRLRGIPPEPDSDRRPTQGQRGGNEIRSGRPKAAVRDGQPTGAEKGGEPGDLYTLGEREEGGFRLLENGQPTEELLPGPERAAQERVRRLNDTHSTFDSEDEE